MKYILTLTRCCTHDCTFCAVDAIACKSVQSCARRAVQEQKAGRALIEAQWFGIVDKVLRDNSQVELDLSGGDCLALPWVWNEFIPYINSKTKNPKQVAVTGTAKSLKICLDSNPHSSREAYAGTIHITYDGDRDYSEQNLKLVPRVQELGIEVHVECPLTVENSTIDKVHEIYMKLRDARISEMLLMSYFPVGRGGVEGQEKELPPPPELSLKIIAEFQKLAEAYPKGPRVKVQCALKGFLPGKKGVVPCKMGKDTWCIMPDGTVLVCPWAYGLNGQPLDTRFVAGNAAKDAVVEWHDKAVHLRNQLRRDFPGQCIIKAFVALSQGGFKSVA